MKQFDTITIYSDDIKATKTYEGLTHIMKKSVTNRSSRIAIQQAVNDCNVHGFEDWNKRTQSRPAIINIVGDLVETKIKLK